MARLIYFLVFVVGLVLVMNISGYQSLTVDNSKFDFDKTAEVNREKEKEIKLLMQPKKKKVEKVVVVKKGPLVELTSPALENGHAQYKKCMICHGKRGEGKSSQNAPAVGGQFDWYLNKQITAMRDGTRVNKVMMPYVSRLTDQDIADLSLYISKLPYMGRKD